MRGLRAIVLAGVAALATMGAAAQQAAAVTSFSGECELRAYSHFFPNRAIVPVPSGFWMSDMGHCAGTLNGKPFDGPVHQYFYANMKTPMGCPVGYSTAAGPMYVTFLTDPKSFNTAAPRKGSYSGRKPRRKASRHRTGGKPRRKASRRRTGGKPRRKASRRRTGGKQHRAGKAHASANQSGLPGEPAPAPPPEAPLRPAPGNNPVMAVWVDEAHVMKGLLARYYGAFRGEAIGITEFEQEPDALLQCANGGLTGSWVNGRMKTITELRG